ncbi:MAG TPA: hypothetical protein VEZ72_15050 [Paenibacillus sp.]|nr:hypothetical protein [Paenibacillus sp.]
MHKVWIALLAATFAGGLAACSAEKPEGASEPPAAEQPPQGTPTEEPAAEEPAAEEPAAEEPQAEEPAAEAPAEEPAKERAEEPAAESPQGDVGERLKGENLVGKTADDVKALYGEPQAQVDDMDYSIWRYDFGVEGYAYGEEVISIDASGFAAGRMLAQLTVEFGDDETADAYSVYSMKDGELMQYRVTKDGAEEYPAAAD